ncbi:agmatinase [Candidatus Methanoperedens nitratireducens]|uniref:Agmatinase n=1 Tax=Candidatus Methanoperedens nitratireducens TaxID=1392998 RepID=A0A284VT00_9EURY|nr:agmatinase [Candidatus Methanoperedens nitroreducens]SNQ62339.1 Agmatinase [Candidatus Methanoperedens nitroreducens]
MHRTVFADANSDYKDARYVICGVPFDRTSCFRRGSRFAPQEIRNNSYNFETYNHLFYIDLKDVDIHDAGDLEVAQGIDDTLKMLSVHADKYVRDGKIPVMLGGEHSLTLPFIRACKTKYPDIACVVLDAHLDMREEYEGERNSHACVSRHIIQDVTGKYVSIGIRSGAREEYEYIKENKIRMFSAEDVLSTGIESVISELRGYINGPVYLSIDMDAIDPAYAPAIGTPEPYGLTPRDVRSVIACLAPHIVGFDLVEIAPAYDSGNTALLGAKLVRDFIAANAKATL